MARFGVILALAAALSFWLLTSRGSSDQTANNPTGREAEQPAFELPQKHKSLLTRTEERGEDLYQYYCALCHGKTGDADGFNSPQLTTPPAKHAEASLMNALSDAQIHRVIKEGGPSLGRSPQMPPWGGVLNDGQIADVTAFIRVLSRRGGGS